MLDNVIEMDTSLIIIRDLAILWVLASVIGLIFRQVGVSPIVGYLVTGLFIANGPLDFLSFETLPYIEVLALMGITLLMFSIGLSIRIANLKSLGLAGIGTAFLTALILFTLVRGAASLTGISAEQGLLIAAIFLTGSPLKISRQLKIGGHIHERSGRLALGISQFEAFIALCILSFLGSMIAVGKPQDPNLAELAVILGLLSGFAVAIVVFGYLIVPLLLKAFPQSRSRELETIFIAGLLFGLAYLAAVVGYAMALGAFLFGLIIAETRQGKAIANSFQQLRHLLAALFFIAVGIMVPMEEILVSGNWILGGCIICLLLRPGIQWINLMLFCEQSRTAIRTALYMIPIGEFSFIIAILGVTSGIIPSKILSATVATAIICAVVAPILSRFSNPIANFLSRPRWPFWCIIVGFYQQLWRGIGRKQEASVLWCLLRFRIFQIGVEMILITVVLIFSEPLYAALEEYAHQQELVWLGLLLPYYWLVLVALVLAPLVAVWRNFQVVAMILADYLTRRVAGMKPMRRGLSWSLQLVAASLALVWLINFLPLGKFRGWLLLAVVGASALALTLGWRKLILWHSNLEISLHDTLSNVPDNRTMEHRSQWDKAGRNWGIVLREMDLPENFDYSGKSLDELALRQRTGASLVGVDRGGYTLQQVGPNTRLFPGDKILLLGEPYQIEKVQKLLLMESDTRQQLPLNSVLLESVQIGNHPGIVGKRLQDLQWPRRYNIQVAAVRRDGRTMLSPTAEFDLISGDELLLIGPENGINEIIENIG